MDYLTFKVEVDSLDKKIFELKTKKEILLQNKKNIQYKIDDIDLELSEQVGIILNRLSDEQRMKACKKLEDLCTYALQYAISPDYKAKIVPSTSRGKPSVDIYIENTSRETMTSPLTENGGGIVDIVSIALRVVAMEAHYPKIDGPIIMDEPYKMVSEEYIPMIAEFTKKISDDFGRQIIFCTHNKFLAETSQSQIEVRMGEDGSSIIKEA